MNPERNLVLSSSNKIYLHGEASTGKTSLACQRLQYLLSDSATADQGILVLVPQRSHATIYQNVVASINSPHNFDLSILTMSSLVRRTIDLFWPLISDISGFYRPYEPPSFLTLETSQYYMGRIVDPLLAKGYFSTVSLSRNRLLGQLVDNLNKAAIIGFPHTEICERLSEAWVGKDSQKRVYEDAQEAINAFRSFCLQNNFVDYSLQVELFKEMLWQNPLCKNYLTQLYKHLIYDNAEEDPPYVHDFVADLWEDLQSALVIQDDYAGYHSFLGADPNSATRFKSMAQETIHLENTNDFAQQTRNLADTFIDFSKTVDYKVEDIHAFISPANQRARFYPEMLQQIADSIHAKIEDGVSPGEIVILSPFLSDATIFTLKTELSKHNINLRALRPSSSLNDDPKIQTLLFFAIICHPEWEIPIDPYRITSTIAYALSSFDLIRSHLIAQEISPKLPVQLPSFDNLSENVRNRLTDEQCAQWNTTMAWINANLSVYPLDIFFSKLFGELLSQPGFAFHQDLESGSSTAQLINSFKKFRHAFGYQLDIDQEEMAKEFVKSVQSGLLAATFVPDEQDDDDNSVLITPVMSFLGLNKIVEYQYWLNVGSSGWYERLEQPLTHPIVLSRHWQRGRKWTAEDDLALNKQTLEKYIRGLFNRCRKEIFLGFSDYSETGQEEKGLLLLHYQALIRRALRNKEDD